MIGFFRKRPKIGSLSVFLVFVTGGVLAHHSRGSATRPKAPALITQKKVKEAKKKPPAPTLRQQVDLDRARLVDGRLQQRLRDGTRVTFTLDPELQAWALKYLDSYNVPYGAMVMMDVKDGKTLIMAGHSSRDDEVGIEQLCLRPWAPAASVFKLVTATALLNRGVPANAQVCYHGGFRGLKKSHIKDNPRLDTTCRSLSYAIAKSINPIMGKLAIRYLGQKHLKRWSRRLGFDQTIPFDLPVSPSKATIPKEKLALARVAAGFWRTEISPLPGAVLAGVAGSGGLLRWPHVIQSVDRPGGGHEVPARKAPRRVINRYYAKQLRLMMVRTTVMGSARRGFQSRRGRPFLRKIKVGGKTGSLSRKHPYLQYSWFVGFAPADKPEVAFAVLLGNPARWRIKAHTAARMMLSRYFKKTRAKKKRSRKVARAGALPSDRLLASR